MGTRANIAISHPDGTVTAIYTHWDGYPDHHGPILQEHYTDPVKIEQLIALGALSVFGPEIGEKHDFDSRSEKDKGWCKAYGRDRGEEETSAVTHASVDAWLEHGEYYNYLWRDGAWWLYLRGAIAARALLADVLAEIAATKEAK